MKKLAPKRVAIRQKHLLRHQLQVRHPQRQKPQLMLTLMEILLSLVVRVRERLQLR